MVTLDTNLIQEYEQLYNTLEIKLDRVDDADNIINKIIENKATYKNVERATAIPWFVIAAIHSLESSLDFTKHLHNGDPLTAKTVNVPAGRPPGNPPFTWTQSAIDALEYNGLANWTDWSIAGICYSFEKYHGLGFRIFHPEVKSPYLWSFSNHYTKGKFVADGIFDPNLVSQQCGVIVLLKRMEQRGLIRFEHIPPHSPVTWLELYRQEEGNAVFPVVAAWATSDLIEVIEVKNRSTEDLADYLRKYPTAKTLHLASPDKPVPQSTSVPTIPPLSDLPILTRILRWGAQGEDVKALQGALNRLGFNSGAEDGDFGDQTEAAVKAYQLRKGLQVDGEVGLITWQAMGGEFKAITLPNEVHLKLADFASVEAAKGLSWNGANSEAEKYLQPLRPIMIELGHMEIQPVFYSWDAAFVTYCCRQVGIDIPDKPQGFWASMALVASWEYWAKQKGYWYPAATTKPRRGDIVTFDWGGVAGRFNHIGVVRGYQSGSSVVQTAEGNVNNCTAHRSRSLSLISGIIRIR